MASNPILSNINAIMPQNNQGASTIEAFDLSDDRFAKILDEKMDEKAEKGLSQEEILSQLGIPAGLHIEGYDFDEMMTQPVSAVNTDNDTKFNLQSFVSNAVESFKPVVETVLENGVNADAVSKTADAIKNFWGSQAQNIYSTMNKESVDNITDLVSRL